MMKSDDGRYEKVLTVEHPHGSPEGKNAWVPIPLAKVRWSEGSFLFFKKILLPIYCAEGVSGGGGGGGGRIRLGVAGLCLPGGKEAAQRMAADGRQF